MTIFPRIYSCRLSIRQKTLLSFLLICVLCFSVLFLIAMPQLVRLSEKNIYHSASQSLSQAQAYISYRMNSLQQLSYSIAYEKSVIRILAHDDRNYPISQQVQDRDILIATINKSLISHTKTVQGVSFFLNDQFVFSSPESPILQPYSGIHQKKWYPSMQNSHRAYYYIPPQWNDSEDSISIVHMVSHPEDYSQFIGAVILDTPKEAIEIILQNCAVTPSSYVYLINESGMLVCSSHADPVLIKEDILKQALETGYSYTDRQNIYFFSHIDICDWTLVQVIPRQDIRFVQFESLRSLILFCVPIIVISIFVSLYLSSSITRRITALSNAMHCFQLNDSAPLQMTEHGDDIDVLIQSYNDMISRINQLTKENIHKQQLLNETELALLHSQIKPHFLYNTLDMIRSFNDYGENEKAALATRALSGFYRSGLGNRTLWSILQNELEHIRSYMAIQRLRYGEQIQLLVDVAPVYLDVNLPRVTLQPLVENSLIHGILSQGQCGLITIRAKALNEKELILTIRDNGCGMTKEMISDFFVSENSSTGIGLWNTNERLQLHYGDSYHLSIDSRINEYTEITIQIPIHRGKENDINEFINRR